MEVYGGDRVDGTQNIPVHDDNQVVDLGIRKFCNDTPGVIVFVSPVEQKGRKKYEGL